MNNLLSYCGLVDARIRASEIDLPVSRQFFTMFFSQKFGKRSAFTGSSTQNEHTDAKEDKFFKAQLSLTSKALVLGKCFLVCYYGKAERCDAAPFTV